MGSFPIQEVSGFDTVRIFKLFCSQTFNGVHNGPPDGLKTNWKDSNEYGSCTGGEKDPPAQIGAIGKVLQLFVHNPPG